MANPGTNTAIQALAKSGITAHQKIEALQNKNQELIDGFNKQTNALRHVTELVGSLMRRIEALEGAQMDREHTEDLAEFEQLTTRLERVLTQSENNPAAEIDPLPPAPPAYTSLAPLADDGGSSEPAPSASSAAH